MRARPATEWRAKACCKMVFHNVSLLVGSSSAIMVKKFLSSSGSFPLTFTPFEVMWFNSAAIVVSEELPTQGTTRPMIDRYASDVYLATLEHRDPGRFLGHLHQCQL